MVSSADVWFRFAIGDYQSSNPERSANSIALGSTSLHLLAQLCLHLSWILVQASDFSPALCHYRSACCHFAIPRSGDAGHLANRDISFGSFRRMHGLSRRSGAN